MDLLHVAFEPALGVESRAAAADLVALILPQILVTQHVVYQRSQERADEPESLCLPSRVRFRVQVRRQYAHEYVFPCRKIDRRASDATERASVPTSSRKHPG